MINTYYIPVNGGSQRIRRDFGEGDIKVMKGSECRSLYVLVISKLDFGKKEKKGETKKNCRKRECKPCTKN